MKRARNFTIIILLTLFFSAATAYAQTTAFTYQGQFQSSGSPATGNFDFEFALYDAQTGGTQVGSTIAVNALTVTNGSFSVTLDFGNVFPGAARFLEIRVRQTGGGLFTTLAPRQRLTSAPYTVKSINAENAVNATSAAYATNADNAQFAANADRLDGLDSSSFVQTNNSLLFIRNQITQQIGSFNISGTGKANIFDAATQYNLSGNPIISTAGPFNLFVGQDAGLSNTTGSSNSFFGYKAGYNNSNGTSNSFFGYGSGIGNTGGNHNSFFGRSSGSNTTSGNENSFFGRGAGGNNQTGSQNTLIGNFADVEASNLINATAIGARAYVSQNNSLVLGSINNINGANASTNVGLGTTAPLTRLDVRGNVFIGLSSQPSASYSNSLFIANDGGDVLNSFRLDGANNQFYIIARSAAGSPTGAGITFRTGTASNGESDRVRINPEGTVEMLVLGGGGSTFLCRNASNEISTCSSSMRYKTNVAPFDYGLSVVNRLRPISFDWKSGGMQDVGFGAEEVAAIDTRFCYA